MRLVISRQHPKAFAERFSASPHFSSPLLKCRQIARADIQVGRLRHDALQSAQIAVNVAEDQYFHDGFFAGACGSVG